MNPSGSLVHSLSHLYPVWVTISLPPAALIGREQEIAHLSGWITACQQGQGRAVLIEGEAGIGKSTLARAACEQASDAGFTVFRGAGDELGQALPLLPFLDALEVRESATDPRRRSVSRLLRGELTAGSPVDVVTAASEQLFGLIEGLAGQAPALLVIDDLQWADAATVALWSRLARAARQLPLPLPLLLLGVARPTPLRDSLRALRRSVDDNVVRLGPLTQPAVRTLLTTLTGAQPGAGLSRLAEGAAGNPLYLTELVGALSRGARLAETTLGTMDVTAGSAPDTLSAAIADRLGFLSEPVRPVLKAAALLGVGFAVDDLSLILRQGVTELLPALDEAIAAGVLADTSQGLSFRHPLIRTALYDELPASVRAALHRDAGRALAAAHAPVDRVARQLLSADDPAGPRLGPVEAWVLDWLVEAGPALVGQAPQAAVDLLRRATASWPAGGTYDVLACRLADALYRVGNIAEAARVTTAALDRVTDPDLLVELHWIAAQAQGQGERGESVATLAAVKKALTNPVLTARHRARLLVTVTRVHRTLGQIDLAGKAAEEALAEATECGDRWATGWALHTLSIVKLMQGDGPGSLPIFERALAVTADEMSLTDLRLLLQVNQAITLGDLDRYPEALEAAHQVRDAASRIGSVVRTAQAHTALGELFFDTGQWDDALVAVAAASDDVKDHGSVCCDRGIAAAIQLHRGETEAARGNIEAAEPHAEVLGDRVVASLAMARATLAEQQGRPADALAGLIVGLQNAEELDETEDFLPDAARLALECGDRDAAASVVEKAEAIRKMAELPHRIAAELYCRGLLDDDPEMLLQSAERYLAAGRPLPRAAALEAAAARFADLGDRSAARSSFSRALDGYTALGANWDAARLQTQFREYGIRRAPRVKHATARSGWQSLTPTETKVAELVVQGLSNPQIAALLYLSPRTVGTHVSHILTKMDLHSRIDLAREAARRDDAGSEA